MTYSVIPLSSKPSQTVTVVIGDQRLRLNVYAKRDGLFVDVYLNDALVLGGVVARNMVKIVRSAYLGVVGDFFFYDTQGDADPAPDGLGGRFVFLYTDA